MPRSRRRYPPALTGLRGQHPGSFEVAHALAREGRSFRSTGCRSRKATIWSWSAAASAGLRRRGSIARAEPAARILILDNHDDFGGHAKRNEFTLDGRRIIGYGGSQSLQSPKTLYSPVAKGLLRDLGVDVARFETAFERGLYPSLGLTRGSSSTARRSAATRWSPAIRGRDEDGSARPTPSR